MQTQAKETIINYSYTLFFRNNLWPMFIAICLSHGFVYSKVRTKRAVDPEAYMSIVSCLLEFF